MDLYGLDNGNAVVYRMSQSVSTFCNTLLSLILQYEYVTLTCAGYVYACAIVIFKDTVQRYNLSDTMN